MTWTTTLPLHTFRLTARNVSGFELSLNVNPVNNRKCHLLSSACLTCSSDGEHLFHGGQCGRPGANGPDGHLRPGGPGRFPELRLRGRRGGPDVSNTRWANLCQSFKKTHITLVVSWNATLNQIIMRHVSKIQSARHFGCPRLTFK